MWAFLSYAWIGLACFDFFAGWTFLVFRVATWSRFDLVPSHVDSLVENRRPGPLGPGGLGSPCFAVLSAIRWWLSQVARTLESHQGGFCSCRLLLLPLPDSLLSSGWRCGEPRRVCLLRLILGPLRSGSDIKSKTKSLRVTVGPDSLGS